MTQVGLGAKLDSRYPRSSAYGLPSGSRLDQGVYLVKRQPLTLIGMLMVLIAVLIAICAPWLAPYDPLEIDLTNRHAAPGLTHWFGTDSLGRDILSRIMFGIRISMMMVVFVLGLSVPFGVAVGAFSGYKGGLLDDIVMRITDIFLAFPPLVLALAIAAALGRGLVNAMLAVSIVWWPWYARLARGQVLSVRQNLYVEAARVAGAGHLRIIFRHILPNSLSPILVLTTLDVGLVILVTAGLSFIGLGASPPTPELGTMIEEGRKFLLEYPWIPTFPGLAITFIALGSNLFGDGLRDILDPTRR